MQSNQNRYILVKKKGVFTPLLEEFLKFSHLPTYPFADFGSQPISLALEHQGWHPKFYLLSVIKWNSRYSYRKTHSRQTQWTKHPLRKTARTHKPSYALAMLNWKHNLCIFSTRLEGSPTPCQSQGPRTPGQPLGCISSCHSRAGLQFAQLPWASQARPPRGSMTCPQPQGGATPRLGLSWCPQLPCSGLGMGWALAARCLSAFHEDPLPLQTPWPLRHLICKRMVHLYQAFICSYQSKGTNLKRFIRGGWGLQR